MDRIGIKGNHKLEWNGMEFHFFPIGIISGAVVWNLDGQSCELIIGNIVVIVLFSLSLSLSFPRSLIVWKEPNLASMYITCYLKAATLLLTVLERQVRQQLTRLDLYYYFIYYFIIWFIILLSYLPVVAIWNLLPNPNTLYYYNLTESFPNDQITVKLFLPVNPIGR